MTRKLLAFLFVTVLSGFLAAQQQQQQRQQPRQPEQRTDPNRRPSQPNRDRPQLGGRTQPSGRDFQNQPRPLSGKVVLEDGSSPSEPIPIEMVCHGRIVRQLFTTSKGTFSFRLGDRNTQIGDASISSSAQGGFGNSPAGSFGTGTQTDVGFQSPGGTLNLNGCELRTSLAGFVSDPIRLGMRRYLENPDVGVMVLHSTNGTGGTGISLNTLRAPKKARKSYRKALKELAKAKANPSKATKELEKAVKVYPEYSAAWYLLGQLRLAAQDHSGGREAFERALAVEPNYVSPYLPLAALELGDRRWKEAAQLSRQVLELNPDAIGAHYSLGVASYFLRNLVTAEQSARKVLDSSEARKYPRMHYLLGIILATKGDFPSAAVQIRRYLKISPNAPEAEPMKKELRKWEAEGRIKSVTATDAG